MKLSMLKAGAVLLCLNSGMSQAALLATFEDIGIEASDIQDTVDEFRAALGPNNGNAPINGDPNGRRQIDWDAVPDSLADPSPFPGDFFNGDSAPRARGIEFEATGKTTGFLLSSTEASGQPTAFGFEQSLPTFSDERLFAPIGGTSFDINFYDPSDQTTQATVRGFGAVFSGLDFGNTVQMQFLNIAGQVVATMFPFGNEEFDLTFAGAIFDTPEIATVRVVTSADRFLTRNGQFEGRGRDGFVFDDFIFGEPIPVAEVSAPQSLALLPFGLMAFAGFRRLRA